MARNYKRDANGRFAGGGGGSGGGGSGGGKKGGGAKSKAGAARSANEATTKRLMNKGLAGVGSRLTRKNAELYSGSKSTRSNRAQLWANAENNQRVGRNPAQRSRARSANTISRGV